MCKSYSAQRVQNIIFILVYCMIVINRSLNFVSDKDQSSLTIVLHVQLNKPCHARNSAVSNTGGLKMFSSRFHKFFEALLTLVPKTKQSTIYSALTALRCMFNVKLKDPSVSGKIIQMAKI